MDGHGPGAAWTAAVRMVALGLALAFLDVRVGGFDVLPDVVGWVLVVVASSRLLPVLPGLLGARRASVVAAVLSVAEAVRPRETSVTRSSTDEAAVVTGTSAFVVPDGVHGVLIACYHSAEVVALVLVCLAVAGAAASATLPAVERRFRSLAWAVGVVQGLTAALALVAVTVGVDSVPPGLTVVLLLLAVAGFGVGVWLLVAVWALRASPLPAAVGGRAPAR